MYLLVPENIAKEDWQQAIDNSNGDHLAAARNLISRGMLNETSWSLQRSRLLGWHYEAEPELGLLDLDLASTLGFSQSRQLGLLPVREQDGVVLVWVRPDINWDTMLEVQAEFGTNCRVVMIPTAAFDRAVQRAFERGSRAADAAQDLDDAVDLETASASLREAEDLLDSDDDAPIIRLLNAVMTQAIEDRASDIHVEPFESRVVIRSRVDGVLRDVVEAPSALAGRIAARIKVMARLNIAEKRLPQDGRISLRLAGRAVDVRVSTLPTHYGERVVMRVLEKEKGPLEFEHIGMPAGISSEFSELIRVPHGIFLVTGPTGSGKTTTLYAALQQVNSPNVNIITAEDPVEYDLPGVSQIPVNTKTGMTFARGLRAILRQDPDVIMVGEIRDLETAQVAVQASLTGHRVFSTLHTNDSVGSITRMIDMGIEPYLVASSLIGAMAQRLLRKLCPDCKQGRKPDAGERSLMGVHGNRKLTIYQPRGCEACGFTGYRGRTGIFELMKIDDDIRQLIHDNQGEQALRSMAVAHGLHSLRQNGLENVLAGETSLEEVLRVSQG